MPAAGQLRESLIKNHAGETALVVAERGGFHDIAEVLRECMEVFLQVKALAEGGGVGCAGVKRKSAVSSRTALTRSECGAFKVQVSYRIVVKHKCFKKASDLPISFGPQ